MNKCGMEIKLLKGGLKEWSHGKKGFVEKGKERKG